MIRKIIYGQEHGKKELTLLSKDSNMINVGRGIKTLEFF